MLLDNEAVSSGGDCPAGCVCKWISGKETTVCAGLGLKRLPKNMAFGTQVRTKYKKVEAKPKRLLEQVIDLRDNHLDVLRNDVFLDSGLINLQRVFCPQCRIAEVEPKAFR